YFMASLARAVQLRRLRRQLEEQQRSLAQRAEELARSNKELEQFAYVASHDLQEPLRMVTVYTQMLEARYKGRLDGDADRFIAFATDGARRMQALIRDLLADSRLDSRARPPEPTDANAALAQGLGNLKVAVEESGAVVSHDPLPVVTGDPSQLAQLFQNLVGNSIKYRGERPPAVHVGAERRGEGWLFSVRDNGIGIDPQYAQRIFLIFHRLHPHP